MQTKRAQEILNSQEKIEVIYNNVPVWIESVSSNVDTAYVKEIGGKKSIEVDTRDLTETGRME